MGQEHYILLFPRHVGVLDGALDTVLCQVPKGGRVQFPSVRNVLDDGGAVARLLLYLQHDWVDVPEGS